MAELKHVITRCHSAPPIVEVYGRLRSDPGSPETLLFTKRGRLRGHTEDCVVVEFYEGADEFYSADGEMVPPDLEALGSTGSSTFKWMMIALVILVVISAAAGVDL
ncbi:MAG: hypothetical protein MR009_06795 [Sutterellaceae bacterium]|nr:hypothetical protein [Sutterellaceae bacterium]MDD7441623.1 hypothetical protein [Sutterellaceae bacterium]MDY2868974.1 hypothetical protein [Mesosutterella sp.]